MTRWSVLIGAVAVQLILGTVYGYSIFWTPLQSKVFPPVVTRVQFEASPTTGAVVVPDEAAARRERDRQEGLLKYIFSICYVAFAGVMLFAGRVQDLKGPRFTAVIGAVLIGAGFLVAGVFLGRLPGSISRLVFLWSTVGLMAGAGIGFAYVSPIAALIKWFPDKKGLVSGVAVAGFGFGAFLFKGTSAIGALGFIQRFGIERFFLLHGLVCLVIVTAGATLLRNPPGTPPAIGRDSTWQQTLRRPAFYVLWVMFFSGVLVGLMVIGIAANFAGEQLVKARLAAGTVLDAKAAASLMLKGAAVVGWLAIFNAAGRITWGFISDAIGRTPAFVINFTVQAVAIFLLARFFTETSLAIAVSVIGFNYGGCLSMFPSATADYFGARNLGANYAWMFTSSGVANMVGVAVGNMAKQRTGSYEPAFIAASGMCLLSVGLAIGLWAHRRRMVIRGRSEERHPRSG
jgi:MFS transporter, OFA family, oxalate/formate antiporter